MGKHEESFSKYDVLPKSYKERSCFIDPEWQTKPQIDVSNLDPHVASSIYCRKIIASISAAFSQLYYI